MINFFNFSGISVDISVHRVKTGPILGIGGMGAFLGEHFLEKKTAFGLNRPLRQTSFK